MPLSKKSEWIGTTDSLGNGTREVCDTISVTDGMRARPALMLRSDATFVVTPASSAARVVEALDLRLAQGARVGYFRD